jgi:uncharacterized phage protein gp47/JayE
MPVAPSFNDLLALFQAEAQIRRADLVFADGDVTLAQQHGAGAMADAVVRFAAQAFRETFIDGASGDALETLVDDHYNLQKVNATPAQGTTSFARTSGGAAGPIPAGTQIGTQFDADGNQIVYATDVVINVGAGDNGPFPVLAIAQDEGEETNAEPGTVTQIIDSLFDDFTVTNAGNMAGGNNAESDEDLRERSRDFFSTLRRGTLAALEFGARVVTTVRVAKAVENDVTGTVDVRVSDSDGDSNAQMISDVEAELENWRCGGSTVIVTGGIKALLDITATLTVRDGFNVAAFAAVIAQAITTRIKKLKVSESLELDTIKAAIISVAPDDILGVDFTAMVLDGVDVQGQDPIVASTSQTIRTGAVALS